MTLTSGIEHAVDRCYETILQPQSWTSALDQLSSALGGSGCNFLAHDRAENIVSFMHSTHMAHWSELWAQNLDWVSDQCSPRGVPRVRQGARSLLQTDLFSQDEIRHSRFHQEIAGPSGCRHWASASFNLGSNAWCMPVFRPQPFTRDDTRQFIEVSRHLERIIRMSRAVVDAQDRTELAALDRFGRAAMLVARDGRVTRMNLAAEALMSPDFRLRHGWLVAADRPSQDRIAALLQAIQTTPPGMFLKAPMALVSREGQAWLAIDVLPMTGRDDENFGGARAILVISDVTEAKARTEADLQSLFGLTPAEARLAAALCSGKDLGQVARAFGVGTATLRSHLKNVFGKTGTGRQAELVAMLARI